MTNHPSNRVFLFACVVLIAVAACGAEQSDQSDEAAPDAAVTEEDASGENPYFSAANLCELVSVQDVAAAAGGIEPLRTEPGTPPPASCRYFFDAPDAYGPRNASATLEMMTDFDLERTGSGSAAQDVPGLGDESWARPHTDSYVLYTRRGNLVFNINVAGVRDEARATTARAIAELVLTKL